MVPASTLRYGSIFWMETLRPRALSKVPKTRRGYTFADGRHHAASYENIFSHANHNLKVGKARAPDRFYQRTRNALNSQNE